VKQVRITVATLAPLGMTLVKNPRGSLVHKVVADDKAKKSALGMLLKSITPKGGAERDLQGLSPQGIAKEIKATSPPYTLLFESVQQVPVGASPELLPSLGDDLQRIADTHEGQLPRPAQEAPDSQSGITSEELRYATPSSIKACHEAARNMHAAAVQLHGKDPEAAALLEARANELFDKGRRYRNIFRRQTELVGYVSRRQTAYMKAIQESKREAEAREARRKCLHDQLERWGYVEREVPDDNNCQFHAIADQLNIDGYLCPDRENGLWSASITRAKIVAWLEKNAKRNMDDGEIGGECTLMMATGHANSREWKKYCTTMSKAGVTWGDEVTLVAACAVFNAQISVISSLTDDCIQTIECPAVWNIPIDRRIVIAHYAEYHYASVQEKMFGDVVEDDMLKDSIEPYAASNPCLIIDRASKHDLHAPDGKLVGPGFMGAAGESL